MSDFLKSIKPDTPRLVVTFTPGSSPEGPTEKFSWGVIGQIPIITLLGFITRVQAELAFRQPDECDESALVIVWNAETKKFTYQVHPDIPVDSLVGMLELAKQCLIGGQMAQMAQAAQKSIAVPSGLIGPDGRPIIKKPY